MSVFDCHVHLSVGDARPVAGLDLPEPEHLLDELHQAGIDRAVCFPAFHVAPDNQALADFARRHSDRVVPFAWLNPHFPGQGDTLREMVGRHGFRGVKLHPVLHGYSPEDPVLDPIMAAAHDLRVPVLVHSGHPLFATPWQVAGLASRWPDVAVIMEHMGLQMSWVDAAIRLAVAHPNLILGVTAMPFFRKIREAVTAIGAERMVWGSDAPALDPASELLRIRRCGLRAPEEQALLGGTLQRLLGELPA